MASVTNTLNLKSLTVEEVIEGILAMQIQLVKQLHLGLKQKQRRKKMMKVEFHLRKLTKTTLIKEVQEQGVVFQELLWLRKKHLRKLKE